MNSSQSGPPESARPRAQQLGKHPRGLNKCRTPKTLDRCCARGRAHSGARISVKTRVVLGWTVPLLLLAGLAVADHLPASPPDRLPRTNLLVFHNQRGEPVPVKTKSDWLKRRAEILQAMQSIMGPLPGKEKRCPLEVKIETETDCGSYIRRLLTYTSEPGSHVPAYLLIPKAALQSKHRAPGALALHPTDTEYGHRVVVESLRPYYWVYARDLVERGFVVLAPSYPLLANYQPDLKALGYESGTMKAIWDNMRGLDLLESLPFVQRGRFVAIGHSLGGHNSIYSAVFDQRIKVVVTSCGFDSYVDYMDGNIKGWTSDRYMPRLLDYQPRLGDIPFDFAELIGALAPRPIFINAPFRDANFKWRSVDDVVHAASPIYQLYGVAGNLKVEHPDCEHDFPAPIREEAYRFVHSHLNR